ncbi:hypothetical protein JOD54_004551 [Actinokineospora baliensis]|uniref:DUF4386 family protein n=1 Tax=Actinokineospora baliensis TaxID=547056 RepID=UPI00195E960B|nr:DUF4386 family protein [Actinokineospora baliensis]MBM7774347.1 hypothetical protein [Actinokineospora baliensis]
MSLRTTAVLVGLLFLTSTAAFAVGSASMGTALGDALVAYTGLAVAGIGLALFPVLKPHGQGLATAYALLRSVECLALLAFATFVGAVANYDLVVYTLSGLGGLALSVLLVRSRLVPRWLALTGVVGYASLLAGVVSEAVGLSELDSGIGMAFYVPGGVFELVLPILLLVKGFRRVEPVGAIAIDPIPAR